MVDLICPRMLRECRGSHLDGSFVFVESLREDKKSRIQLQDR
jgi:hypothetical protein